MVAEGAAESVGGEQRQTERCLESGERRVVRFWSCATRRLTRRTELDARLPEPFSVSAEEQVPSIPTLQEPQYSQGFEWELAILG